MHIVDSQVCIWSADTPDLPWLQGGDLEWVMGYGVCAWLGWPL
jgi:hypothetical protein